MVLKRQKVSYATHGEIRKFQCPQGRYFYEPQIPTAFGSLYGIGADFLNWGEPAKFTCAVHTGKGKGQGSKGEPNLRTDTVGGDF